MRELGAINGLPIASQGRERQAKPFGGQGGVEHSLTELSPWNALSLAAMICVNRPGRRSFGYLALASISLPKSVTTTKYSIIVVRGKKLPFLIT